MIGFFDTGSVHQPIEATNSIPGGDQCGSVGPRERRGGVNDNESSEYFNLICINCVSAVKDIQRRELRI